MYLNDSMRNKTLDITADNHTSLEILSPKRIKFDHFEPILPNKVQITGSTSLSQLESKYGVFLYTGNIKCRTENEKNAECFSKLIKTIENALTNNRDSIPIKEFSNFTIGNVPTKVTFSRIFRGLRRDVALSFRYNFSGTSLQMDTFIFLFCTMYNYLTVKGNELYFRKNQRLLDLHFPNITLTSVMNVDATLSVKVKSQSFRFQMAEIERMLIDIVNSSYYKHTQLTKMFFKD